MPKLTAGNKKAERLTGENFALFLDALLLSFFAFPRIQGITN